MAGPTVDIFCGIVAGIERFPRLSGVQLRAIQISDQAGQCEPEKRRNNREVVQASRVINADITLHINDQRVQHVNHRSAEQMEVHFFPSHAASQPQKHELKNYEAIMSVGYNVEIM